MNKIHSTVVNFKEGRRVMAAASEFANKGGAGASCGVASGQPLPALRVLSAVLALAWGGVSFALPTGGQVVHGQASIAISGPVMRVQQSSANATINWHNFGVGTGEQVLFSTPGAQALTLNRVSGSTNIQGLVQSNGSLWFSNPNGVFTVRNGGSIRAAGEVFITGRDIAAGQYIKPGGGVNTGAALLDGTAAIAARQIHIDLSSIHMAGANLAAEVKAVVQATGSIEAQGATITAADQVVIGRDDWKTGGLAKAVDLSGARLQARQVETSAEYLRADGIDLRGTGEWLLDPTSLTISASASTGGSLATAAAEGGASNVSATDLQNVINAGTSVTLTATGSITQSAPLTFDVSVAGQMPTLTLDNTSGAKENITLAAITDSTTATDSGVSLRAHSAGGVITVGGAINVRGAIILDNTFGRSNSTDQPTSDFISIANNNLGTLATTADNGVGVNGPLLAGMGITLKGVSNNSSGGVKLSANVSSSQLHAGHGIDISGENLFQNGIYVPSAVTLQAGTSTIAGSHINLYAYNASTSSSMYGPGANLSISTYGGDVNIGSSAKPTYGGEGINNVLGVITSRKIDGVGGNVGIFATAFRSDSNAIDNASTITADGNITIVGNNTSSSTTTEVVSLTGAITLTNASNNSTLSITGNTATESGYTGASPGLSVTGAIAINSNGGGASFVSNNRINQTGAITLAANTSGTVSSVSYNTTTGTKDSTITIGALTVASGSTSDINFIEKTAGAGITAAAINVPGYILLDNTWGGTAGAGGTPTSGFITSSNYATTATTTANGVTFTGNLTAGKGITLRGASYSANHGVYSAGLNLTTAQGDIVINGISNTGSGYWHQSGGTLTATTGNISLTGYIGAGNAAVNLNTNLITAPQGSITANGTVNGNGNFALWSSGTISAGAGIAVTGTTNSTSGFSVVDFNATSLAVTGPGSSISVNATRSTAGGSAGINTTGTISGGNGSNISFVSNNSINQTGAITLAPNTSTDSNVIYDTTSGTSASTITAGPLSVSAGTSTKAINFIEKTAGAGITAAAINVPGYILLDNTWGGTGGEGGTPTSGFITTTNAVATAATTGNGITLNGALSSGSFSGPDAITIKGVVNSGGYGVVLNTNKLTAKTGNIDVLGMNVSASSAGGIQLISGAETNAGNITLRGYTAGGQAAVFFNAGVVGSSGSTFLNAIGDINIVGYTSTTGGGNGVYYINTATVATGNVGIYTQGGGASGNGAIWYQQSIVKAGGTFRINGATMTDGLPSAAPGSAAASSGANNGIYMAIADNYSYAVTGQNAGTYVGITAGGDIDLRGIGAAGSSGVGILIGSSSLRSTAGTINIQGSSGGKGVYTTTGAFSGGAITLTGSGGVDAGVYTDTPLTTNNVLGIAGNIAITGTMTSPGSNTGITQSGQITQNANGGSISFVSNNSINQTGAIAMAANTSGSAASITYDTTTGTRGSSITTGTLTLTGGMSGSNNDIDYSVLTSGAPITVGAVTVPGSITLNNGYLNGVAGGITLANADTLATNTSAGVTAAALTAGRNVTIYGVSSVNNTGLYAVANNGNVLTSQRVAGGGLNITAFTSSPTGAGPQGSAANVAFQSGTTSIAGGDITLLGATNNINSTGYWLLSGGNNITAYGANVHWGTAANPVVAGWPNRMSGNILATAQGGVGGNINVYGTTTSQGSYPAISSAGSFTADGSITIVGNKTVAFDSPVVDLTGAITLTGVIPNSNLTVRATQPAGGGNSGISMTSAITQNSNGGSISFVSNGRINQTGAISVVANTSDSAASITYDTTTGNKETTITTGALTVAAGSTKAVNYEVKASGSKISTGAINVPGHILIDNTYLNGSQGGITLANANTYATTNGGNGALALGSLTSGNLAGSTGITLNGVSNTSSSGAVEPNANPSPINSATTININAINSAAGGYGYVTNFLGAQSPLTAAGDITLVAAVGGSSVNASSITSAITSTNGNVTITATSSGTGITIDGNAAITGNKIAITGTASSTQATVISLGALAVNACSTGCSGRDLTVTATNGTAGGNMGITQSGAITQNANGGSISFVSNNRINQTGAVSVAANTSGTASSVTYDTTSGNRDSTITAGAPTVASGSTSAVNYILTTSGAPITVSALNMPGYILLDNTNDGATVASSATTSNGITHGALTSGALASAPGIRLRGVTSGGTASAITGTGELTSASGVDIRGTGSTTANGAVSQTGAIINTGGAGTGVWASSTFNIGLDNVNNSGDDGIRITGGFGREAGSAALTHGTITALGTLTNTGGVIGLSMAQSVSPFSLEGRAGITSANASTRSNVAYTINGGAFSTAPMAEYTGGNYVNYRSTPSLGTGATVSLLNNYSAVYGTAFDSPSALDWLRSPTNTTVTLDGAGLGVTGDIVLAGLKWAANIGPGGNSNKAQSLTSLLSGSVLDFYGTSLSLNGTTSTYSITPKPISPTNVTAQSKVYDGTTTATLESGNLIVTGLLDGDVVTLSPTGVFADKNVGNGKTVNVTYSASGADAANYTFADSTTTANITPKLLVPTGITANNKVYDGTTTGTANLTTIGLRPTVSAAAGTSNDGSPIAGDDVSFNPADIWTVANATFADKNVGTAKTVTVGMVLQTGGPTLLGTDSGNYVFVMNDLKTTADITPKTLTVSGITANNRVYDGSTDVTLNTSGLVKGGLVAGDDVTVSVTGAFVDRSANNAKTVNLTSMFGGADRANYTVIDQATTTATISPKPLSVSGLSSANKVYDGTTTAIVSGTATLADAITAGTGSSTDGKPYAGDQLTVTGPATGDFNSKGVLTASAVSFSGLQLGGAEAANYTLLNHPTVASIITPRTLDVTALVGPKTYDGSSAATAALSLSGLLGSDAVVVNGTTTLSGRTAGTQTATTTGLALTGPDAGNYALAADSVPAGTVDVARAPLTVTGEVTSRVYNAQTQTNTYTLTGLAAGESATVSGSAQARNVSQGTVADALQIQADSGTDLNNYSLTIRNGSLTIAPLTVTATALVGPKTYDGSSAATAALSLSGLLGSDAVVVNGTTTLSGKTAGTQTATTTGLALTGPDAGNYALAADSVPAGTVDVARKTVQVQGSSVEARADGVTTFSNPAPTIIGLAAGDVVNFSGMASSRESGTFVDRLVASGADADNYLFDLQPGVLLIKPLLPAFDASTFMQAAGQSASNSGGLPTSPGGAAALLSAGESIRVALVGLSGNTLPVAAPASSGPLPARGALTLALGPASSALTLTTSGGTTTLELGGQGAAAVATIPAETTPSLPVFRLLPGGAAVESALTITDQGATLSALPAAAAQAKLDLVGSGRLVGSTEATVSAPSGGPVTVTVTLTAEGVLVVQAPRALAEASDEKPLVLIALALARQSLGVRPAQVRGLVIQPASGP